MYSTLPSQQSHLIVTELTSRIGIGTGNWGKERVAAFASARKYRNQSRDPVVLVPELNIIIPAGFSPHNGF